MCVWLKRERGIERKGGRWRPQQMIVKWVSMAEEREMMGDRERKRAREEIKEVSMAAGREKREHEKEREG